MVAISITAAAAAAVVVVVVETVMAEVLVVPVVDAPWRFIMTVCGSFSSCVATNGNKTSFLSLTTAVSASCTVSSSTTTTSSSSLWVSSLTWRTVISLSATASVLVLVLVLVVISILLLLLLPVVLVVVVVVVVVFSLFIFRWSSVRTLFHNSRTSKCNVQNINHSGLGVVEMNKNKEALHVARPSHHSSQSRYSANMMSQ